MDSNNLLKILGENFNLSLSLSEQHTCSVIFDEDEVIFEENNRQLYIYAVLGSSVGREELCRELLIHSNLGVDTGCASIGLDPERHEFLLYRILSGSLEYTEFQDILVLFIKALRYWKKWLSDPGNVQAPKDADQPESLDLFMKGSMA